MSRAASSAESLCHCLWTPSLPLREKCVHPPLLASINFEQGGGGGGVVLVGWQFAACFCTHTSVKGCQSILGGQCKAMLGALHYRYLATALVPLWDEMLHHASAAGSFPCHQVISFSAPPVPGAFSLSIRDTSSQGDVVRHYKIRRMDHGGYYICPRTTFPSLQQLVSHYSSKLPLKEPRFCTAY